MTNKISLVLITLVGLLSLVQPTSGATNDQITILSHDQELVITDPTQGYNSYANWIEFPSAEISYRKVMLNITYACPDGLHCGEWDYIDHIFLRQRSSADSDSLNIELARMISPYGWRFDSTWSFSWSVDLTDFALLLHDSALIEFKHTGYEKTDDRGWLITLEFVITEGQPSVEILGMDTLWCGRFPYGDTSQPIESLLAPIEFTHETAEMVRLRIHQTGHGMDSYENCAEFCKKYRRVSFDHGLVDQRELWRKCGDNPLFPQAGTWIFDRANWCPGQVVFPDQIDYAITPDSTHSVDIEMQAYLNLEKPTANWSIYSYLFYANKPWAKNDVTLEEILVPSVAGQNSRLNPACARPVIEIKNSGSETLKSVRIEYGSDPEKLNSYDWRGNLKSQQATLINLPGLIGKLDGHEFVVRLSSPNSETDEYSSDNELNSILPFVPSLPSEFVINLLTNAEPHHNEYQLRDSDGFLLGGRARGSMAANRNYRDTFDLDPGCYQLILTDTSSDGLALWFNPEGGFGYLRLLDKKEQLLKAFGSDCGSIIDFWFTVAESSPSGLIDSQPQINVFPPRNEGQFDLHLFFNEPTDIAVAITHDSLGTVYEKTYDSIKDEALAIDISDQPDGRYKLNVTAEGETITRRLRIRHKE